MPKQTLADIDHTSPYAVNIFERYPRRAEGAESNASIESEPTAETESESMEETSESQSDPMFQTPIQFDDDSAEEGSRDSSGTEEMSEDTESIDETPILVANDDEEKSEDESVDNDSRGTPETDSDGIIIA